MPLLLNEAEVKSLLPMGELIATMESALAAFSKGEVDQPVRSVVQVGEEKNYFGTMPAYMPSGPAVGAKLVTVFNGNIAKGLTSHMATILLLDPETGALLALMDGRYITEARTAAVSAVSMRCLAREDAKTLAILGSGVQAHSHIEALSHVRMFDEIRVYSPTRANLERFCEQTGTRACASAEEACVGADVIVTVTAARETVVRDAWVREGAHIISVGACRPTHRELEGSLVARCSVYVDSRAAAMHEAGDILLAIQEGLITKEHIVGELGERPTRRSANECTMFKSLGMAVEDVASANLVYRKALAEKLGRSFSL
jgi:ornithine cyclodeaminase/alanine dehydrogenase-like protein (mu-crystallin family)